MARSPSKSFAILGAGITGLTAAYRLNRLGHGVRIFEHTARIGGAIRTEHAPEGWLVEGGPNSLVSGEPAAERLIAELGLAPERLSAAPSAQQRYLVRRGALVPAPLTPGEFVRSPLFSPIAKLAIAAELFARPRIRTSDVSLSEFVSAHFGREFVDYALDPFVTGVYAGDPRKLSARYAFPKLWETEQTTGSLLRAQQTLAKTRRARDEQAPVPFSFRRGLQSLTDRLAEALPPGAITLETSLDAIVPGERWNVVWHDAAGTHTQGFDAMLLALPAHALAQLRIGALGERPLAALAAVEHPPVVSLFLGYRREQVSHPLDGFGLLVPSVEKRSLLGVLFSSSLFPGRAPEGHVALTVMIGGVHRPELASLSPDELLSAVQPDLTQLLGVSGEPVFRRQHTWPRAIPQYNVGHEQILAAIAAAERAHPGLLVGGPARDGISVPACIAAGETLAVRAAAV